MNGRLRLGMAQLNLCVGDIDGNTSKIIETIIDARDRLQIDLIAFPELAITGYPPEDLLFRPELHRRVEHAIEIISHVTNGITVALGHPEQVGEDLFNSCSIIRDRVLIARYQKHQLPNYAVFDEKRYFTAGHETCVVEVAGFRLSISICEDIWEPQTAAAALSAGAELILNINASPYRIEKRSARLNALRDAVAVSGLPIAYVNLVGGQDELVFDGGSLVVDATGEVVVKVKEFEETVAVVDITRSNNQLVFNGPDDGYTDHLENVYAALVLGVRDYIGKNNFPGAVLGLSGGIDSALTLAIAVDAIGAERVRAVSMPSRYTAQMSIDDALEQARRQGCECHVIPIEKPFGAFNDVLHELFAERDADVTEENMQARCRGVILMAISNKLGQMVLATGNKSEMSVGYATLYGDMAGGFAPLKDVPKTLVYALSKWRNSQSIVIPERVIERPPTAELAPDQADTDSLPPYDVLDPILEDYIEHDLTPLQISAKGFDLEIVRRVTKMVDRNEYKRRQAAPGVRVSERAFGRDRRFPITSRYSEQAATPPSSVDG
ncbi:MAG: NAD+ synthase (glutamine-hydrolyzing) [Gammaproteobacteria bacterium]|jgi:NAD+ synthase (glutamine-hydrolysing)